MIRVGTAGWSYDDWEGVVYPRRKPRGFHPLPFLARWIDCVEVNSSFYAIPRPQSAARWAAWVADRPNFRFTAKLYRGFTHEGLVPGVQLERDADLYRESLEPLRGAGRLASVLVQFPLSFRPDETAHRRLAWIGRRFGDLRLVYELRHRDWFEPESLRRIEALGGSLAEIDLPAAPDHPPAEPPPIGPLGYLRLHGRNAEAWLDPRASRDRKYDYLYSPEEVRGLLQRARRIARGRDETYVITNNHFAGKALVNAAQLLAGLGHDLEELPAELRGRYPGLEGLGRSSAQGELF